MSLPQRDAKDQKAFDELKERYTPVIGEVPHTCYWCSKTVGKDCQRKRRVIEGYCTEFSLGVKNNQ